MTDDEAFLQKFEAAAWPQDQWHHREHIKTAYLYLSRHSFDEALARLRSGIQALNASHGLPESPTRGYHETMTQAWLRLVQAMLQEHGPAESADVFYQNHPELSQAKVLRLFYSPRRLMAPEAKTHYLEPDLAPLPVSNHRPS